MNETEITIPVPWGHIAGKTWNKPNGTPVLMVHGLQDNAASFDALVLLLPDSFYCVAIDLPGHGKSSHFPWGLTLKTIDAIPAIERVVDFLGWKDFIYIGHSLGGILGFFYCAIYPQRVRKFVALDVFLPIVSDEERAGEVVSAYNSLKEIEKRVESGKAPEYSYDEAVQRIIGGRRDYISLGSARKLASRCLLKSGAGYKFSMDQRLKSYERVGFSLGQILELFKEIQCPILHLIGSESFNAFRRTTYANYIKTIRDSLERKNKNSYRSHVVEGGHNVHMDFPERVSPFLNAFLSDSLCRL